MRKFLAAGRAVHANVLCQLVVVCRSRLRLPESRGHKAQTHHQDESETFGVHGISPAAKVSEARP